MKYKLAVYRTLLLLLIILPSNAFQTYLLFKHVEATELMWMLWIFTVPFALINYVIAATVLKKEDYE